MNDCPLKEKICNLADEMCPHYRKGNCLLKEDYRPEIAKGLRLLLELIGKFVEQKGDTNVE